MYPFSPEYMFVYLASLRELAEWNRVARGEAEPSRRDRPRRSRLRTLASQERRPSARPATR